MPTISPGPAAPATGAEGRAGRARRETIARGLILLAAFVSFILSVSLWFAGNEMEGVFVGIWVPSIIALGAFLLPRRADR
ncbi:MAG: hypothetical protein RIB98_02365 [Acidimicrobiales bacterium]